MISSRDTPLPSARPGQMSGLRRAQCALPPLNKCEGNLESRRRGLSLVRLPAGRLAAGACPPGSWTRRGRGAWTWIAAPSQLRPLTRCSRRPPRSPGTSWPWRSSGCSSACPCRPAPAPPMWTAGSAGASGSGLYAALADVQPGDGPPDQHPLDLRRALEDREDLGVAMPAFDRVFARVAVATEDLDG